MPRINIKGGPPQKALGVGLDDGGIGELLGMGIAAFGVTGLLVGAVEEIVGLIKAGPYVGVNVGKPRLGPRGAVHFCCNLGKKATPPIMIAITTRINKVINRFLFGIWLYITWVLIYSVIDYNTGGLTGL
jgi:hypothetical protein